MIKHNQFDELKIDLITFFFSCAEEASKDSKHKPELARQLFRRLINNTLPKLISVNITDSLIDLFLRHVNAKDKYKDAEPCANACVNAIADTVIQSMKMILDAFYNK
ncbi:hypothetical protein [Cardinium endosymbiont of Nabis limbatus]|uniref:hypothetical protein n=1 Tax=Cardinium endosymbiont of Nabis limbatus TaxID=3066217 RepID=UPI003AF3713D